MQGRHEDGTHVRELLSTHAIIIVHRTPRNVQRTRVCIEKLGPRYRALHMSLWLTSYLRYFHRWKNGVHLVGTPG
jgi:hypothetical protein